MINSKKCNRCCHTKIKCKCKIKFVFGPPGPSGPQGSSGNSGSPGQTGTPGIDGSNGSNGSIGNNGATGVSGSPGTFTNNLGFSYHTIMPNTGVSASVDFTTGTFDFLTANWTVNSSLAVSSMQVIGAGWYSLIIDTVGWATGISTGGRVISSQILDPIGNLLVGYSWHSSEPRESSYRRNVYLNPYDNLDVLTVNPAIGQTIYVQVEYLHVPEPPP
jgi:hypothetical protein